MEALELYKFVHDNSLEWHWYGDDVILFINFPHLKEFGQLCTYSFFDDGGIKVTMKQDYICLEMKDVCEYFDIDIQQIFKRD